MADTGEPTLHEAAERGDVARIRALLEANPRSVAACDASGWTPLHRAARAGQVEAMRALLDGGADVEDRACAAPRVQPLHAAVASGNEAAVAVLLAAGADASVPRDGGITPLQDAEAAGQPGIARMLRARGAR